MGYYYDRQGKPLTIEQWVAVSTNEYKRVAEDYVGEAWVSTVWLGIDHSFGYDSVPIIFETMVFGGPHDQEQWRYATEKQAQEGHAAIVSILQGIETLTPELPPLPPRELLMEDDL